jgi:hypothetical protein
MALRTTGSNESDPHSISLMHASLLQMALIPFAMSRFSIAALSESLLDRFVPLNRTLRMHIHLGYTMVLVVFLDTAFFFTFFGILCADGEQAYCDKFTSEINHRLWNLGHPANHCRNVVLSSQDSLRDLLRSPSRCLSYVH